VQPEDAAFFDRLLQGMGRNFYSRVITEAAVGGHLLPAVTNYMDGRNGVYRYRYATTGSAGGYGPYGLSGILVVGWWSLLKSDASLPHWQRLAQAFPLDDGAVAFYVGPNTTRVRHPLVTYPAFFTNGFGELSVRLGLALQSSGP
jgi:hypothetical protein